MAKKTSTTPSKAKVKCDKCNQPIKGKCLNCLVCHRTRHFDCCSIKLSNQVKGLPWTCESCCYCHECHGVRNEPSTYVRCDMCDREYHVKCVPLSFQLSAISDDTWNCPSCAVGNIINSGAKKSTKQTTSDDGISSTSMPSLGDLIDTISNKRKRDDQTTSESTEPKKKKAKSSDSGVAEIVPNTARRSSSRLADKQAEKEEVRAENAQRFKKTSTSATTTTTREQRPSDSVTRKSGKQKSAISYSEQPDSTPVIAARSANSSQQQHHDLDEEEDVVYDHVVLIKENNISRVAYFVKSTELLTVASRFADVPQHRIKIYHAQFDPNLQQVLKYEIDNNYPFKLQTAEGKLYIHVQCL